MATFLNRLVSPVAAMTFKLGEAWFKLRGPKDRHKQSIDSTAPRHGVPGAVWHSACQSAPSPKSLALMPMFVWIGPRPQGERSEAFGT